MGRVVLVARAQMDPDERALAVGYHADFGVPPSPGDADGPGAPFFGAPAACWWTFPPVESMAGTRISTPMIRSLYCFNVCWAGSAVFFRSVG